MSSLKAQTPWTFCMSIELLRGYFPRGLHSQCLLLCVLPAPFDFVTITLVSLFHGTWPSGQRTLAGGDTGCPAGCSIPVCRAACSDTQGPQGQVRGQLPHSQWMDGLLSDGQAWEGKGWGNQGSLPGEGESGDCSNRTGRKCFECVGQNSLATKATKTISDEGWELYLS